MLLSHRLNMIFYEHINVRTMKIRPHIARNKQYENIKIAHPLQIKCLCDRLAR